MLLPHKELWVLLCTPSYTDSLVLLLLVDLWSYQDEVHVKNVI